MRLLFLLLAVLGVCAYMGYIQLPTDIVLPGDTLGSMRSLSKKVLKPLDDKETISTQEARSALAELRATVANRRSDPDYQRMTQLLTVLDQAIEERYTSITRVYGGTTANALDSVPGKWHLVGHPEKHVDPTEISHQERSSFWTEATTRKWRERCDYYKATVDAILGQPASSRLQ